MILFDPGFVGANGIKRILPYLFQYSNMTKTKSEIIRGQRPEAPSPIPCPVMQELPEEMTKERIKEMIGAFGDAALRAKKAGADGVEIHGAHGYLIGEFMSAYANQRTDEYGGSLQNRMRFPIEVVKEIRKRTGVDFPISFRFSYDEKVRRGNNVEDSIQMARMLEQASLADPKLPRKMMEEREEEIIPCISCNKGCLDQVFQGKNVGCIYNPRTGREKGGTQ